MTTALSETRAESQPARWPRRRPGLAWTSILLSLALLTVSVLFVDSRRVLASLQGIDTRWIMAAFAVSLLQLVVLGIRYSHIARAVGLKFGWVKGTTEYALSVLVNQVLPTGVLGDGLRAARQAKESEEHGFLRSLEAVALDRLAGHLALWLVVIATAWLGSGSDLLEFPRIALGAIGALGAAAVLLTLLGRIAKLERFTGPILQFARTSGRVLAAPRQLVVHLPLSLAMTSLTVLQLYIAARAVGVELSFGQLLGLGPLILLSMSLPSFFAGWGIREGVSAVLFASVGLPGSTGVAVALVYGAFALIVSLPGVIVLLFDPSRGVAPRTRWSQAHSLSMVAGLGLALWSHFPPLLAFVAALSFLILIVQSRTDWTPTGRFGMANAITSIRLLLTLLLLCSPPSWPAVSFASVALSVLCLDVLDGWWARRCNTQSDFGAQFDVEVDTLLVASLSLALLVRGQAGLWVILPLVLRYLYVLSPVCFPPLREPSERTKTGRAAYVFMIASFVAALMLPAQWGNALALSGTLATSISFLGSFWKRYGPA